MLTRYAVLAGLLTLSAPAIAATKRVPTTQPQEVTAAATKFVDGDTAYFGKLHCRFLYMDAPEKNQPFGRYSAMELKQLVGTKPVRIVTHGKDEYGRDLCEVYNGETNVALEMVANGWAWAYRKHLKDKPPVVLGGQPFEEAEEDARKLRRGLWNFSAVPCEPYTWRHHRDQCGVPDKAPPAPATSTPAPPVPPAQPPAAPSKTHGSRDDCGTMIRCLLHAGANL